MRSDTRLSNMMGTTIHHGSQSLAHGDKFRKRNTQSRADVNYTKKEQQALKKKRY